MNMTRICRFWRAAPIFFPLLFAAAARADAPPSPWSPELGPAFELYYAGDYAETQKLCRRMNAEVRGETLQREIAALDAMATMRMEGRDNRLEGQTRLSQLADEDVSLLDRPECRLAYGAAETSLYATASALFHLDRAAAGFEKRGRLDRLAETLATTAEAWARHSEWELSVPGMDMPRPESPADADAIRCARIRELRRRAAKAPNAAAQVDEIDLTLARLLLRLDGGDAEAVALLTRLAERTIMTKAAAEAGLMLAEHYETLDRWAEALDLYERISNADLGAFSEQAELRLHVIREPSLEMKTPRQVRPGQKVAVEVTTRGLSRVEFELRRVDLIDWLTRRQGRFDETALPVAGAVIAVRELSPNTTLPYQTWSSDSLAEPLVFEAPTGAAVAVVRAVRENGRTLIVKRLVLGGDLTAYAFSGRDNLALWIAAGDGSTAPPRDAEALVWMRGSFVPRSAKIEGNVVVMPFPSEARMLRDKRWTCVVRAGEQMCLCQGALSAKHKIDRLPFAVLAGGPAEVGVGQTYHLFGALLDAPLETYAGRRLEIVLLGPMEQVIYACEAPITQTGTFAVHVPIEPSLANVAMLATVRLDGRSLEQIHAPPHVRVRKLDASPARLTFEAPAWLETSDKIQSRLVADYPWAAVLSNASVKSMFLPVVLPDNVQGRPAFYPLSRSRLGKTGEDGILVLAEEMKTFDLPTGPRAAGQWAELGGPDGRSVGAETMTLAASLPVHLWLEIEETAPSTGRPLHFQVHWFDPGGRTAGLDPSLTIYRDGAPAAKPRLIPFDNFLRSRTWRPTSAGEYQAIVELNPRDCEPLIARMTFAVEPSSVRDSTAALPPRVQALRARQDDRDGVSVRLEGVANSLLLLLADAGEPLATREIAELDGVAEVFMPAPVSVGPDLQLLVVDSAETEAWIIDAVEVAPATHHAAEMRLSVQENDVLLGNNLDITVECRRDETPIPDATLIARLANITASGGVRWLPGKPRTDADLRSEGLSRTSSLATFDAHEPTPGILETRVISAELTHMLYAGETVWIGEAPVENGVASMSPSIPQTPGYYRLTTALLTPEGERVVETRDWDLRHELQLSADLPAVMQSGDRLNAALEITNATGERRELRIAFDGGAGLRASDWRLPEGEVGVESVVYGETPVLTLAPGGRAFVHLGVEAADVGADRATFAIECGAERRATSVAYVVQDASETSAEGTPTIRIQRTLYRLTEAPSAVLLAESDGAGAPHDKEQRWVRTEIIPGESLRPGELILVEETLTLAAPLSSASWDQQLPANCFTHREEQDEFRRIGGRRNLRLQSVGYDATRLPDATLLLHEYVVVPVRPGVCIFPPPEIIAAGVSVPATVECLVQEVIVKEP